MKRLLHISRIVVWALTLYLLWISLRLIVATDRNSYDSFSVGRRLGLAWPTFAVGVLLVLPYWKARGRLSRYCGLGIFGVASLIAIFWSLMGVVAVLQAEDTPSTLPLALASMAAVMGNYCYVLSKKAPIQLPEPTSGLAPGRGSS